MQKIIVTKGLPASGKTTWAKEELSKNTGKMKRVNKDELRAMLDTSVYSKANESFVIKVRDFIIMETLKSGLSVISDDTNLAEKHIVRFKQLADIYSKESGKPCSVEIKDFTNVSALECVRRDQFRANSVGEGVIISMYNQFIRKAYPKYVPPVDGLEKVVICDLDGTLAILNGRNPYDASTCLEDEINYPVHSFLQAYMNVVNKIIFFSGREDKDREPTLKFLIEKCGFKSENFELQMRNTGDNRKDSIVKRELFDKWVHGKYNPVLWLDDRQQVCDMVRRDLGIPLFQVNEGLF